MLQSCATRLNGGRSTGGHGVCGWCDGDSGHDGDMIGGACHEMDKIFVVLGSGKKCIVMLSVLL